MARPKGKKRLPVTLTLTPETRRKAGKIAFNNNESFSALVDRLLRELVAGQEGGKR